MSFGKLEFIGLWVNYCPLCLLVELIKKWDISVVPLKLRVFWVVLTNITGYYRHDNIKEGVFWCF